MKIIALGHRKRMGKDAAGQLMKSYLQDQCGFGHVKVAGFADEIKRQTFKLFAWAGLQDAPFYNKKEYEHLREVVLPKIGMTPRQIWINHGMSTRTYYDNVWVDYLLNTADCDVLIVTDLRFPNEIENVRKHGGVVFKVARPGIPHTPDVADNPLLDYTGWDDIITNDGDLFDLRLKCVEVLKTNYLTEPKGA